MKQLWETQAKRIDALSLRERAIMFVSIAAAMGALADTLVLSPKLAERRQITAQLRESAQQLETLRTQLAARDGGDATPEGRQRAAIARASAEQASLDQQIRAQLAGRDEMARLPEVLDRLLRRHERLELTGLATATPLKGAVSNSPNTAANVPPSPAIRWQGVDLRVAGSYPDLVQYVADLEQALPGLRWGPLQIASPTQPSVLSVRLMLPGDNP